MSKTSQSGDEASDDPNNSDVNSDLQGNIVNKESAMDVSNGVRQRNKKIARNEKGLGTQNNGNNEGIEIAGNTENPEVNNDSQSNTTEQESYNTSTKNVSVMQRSSPFHEDKKAGVYPSINPSDFNIDDCALSQYIKGYDKIPVKNNKELNIKIGESYEIIKAYQKTSQEELNVIEGDSVQLDELPDSAWCKVTNIKTNQNGFIPRDCIFQKNGGVKVTSSQNSQLSCSNVINWSSYKFKFLFIIIIINLFIIIAIPIYYYYPLMNQGNNEEESLKSKIVRMSKQYSYLSEDVWITLSLCLNNALQDTHPCIILMLNDGRKDFSELLHDIGRLSVDSFKLNEENNNADTILVEGSKISKSDSDFFFKDHKCKLEKNKVMLVDEMEKVPGNIMELFHSLCDVYDPAVKQAVIVFLLNHKDIKVDPGKNDATLAMNILSELWKYSIHHDLIDPLAIRVTENVINLSRK